MNSIIEIKDLQIAFRTDSRDVTVIDNVNFRVDKGETLGIVGESGCGKSVTSMSIMGLLPPIAKVTKGSIKLKDRELVGMSKKQLRSVRGKEIAMIFQEPMTSLNPVYNIGKQIIELILNHRKVSKKEAKAHALEMLKLVGIPRPEEVINEYPHQLSGGMRQRVMIALAMSCNPEVLIADEPTTALDVTIQAQILELMKDLQKKLGMSIILITHDLGVVAEMCDRVVVMYAGQVVEECTIEQLFTKPHHPYTEGLLASVPNMEEEQETLTSIPGTVPSPGEMPKGCRFAERCPYVLDRCFEKVPELFVLGPNTKSRCWLNEPSESGGVQ
ncbi:ABC transporter ATP-binding protein [Halalkalibacterium ligniniphilum]|uniref:ABC transporter ATP-binding protein n=1 Tax=Halalkalibacterium ligniniphilum TaxID=1134413 RepID=UPI00034A42C8|nr:ABC transporter ATP-binding protein [Halalkalibacterium ligniniphilum]